METFLPWAQKYGYLAIFAVLLAAGFGSPIPEDIPLLTGGWLCHEGALSVGPTILIGLSGVLLGDSLIFLAGRKVGGALDQHPWFKRHFGGPRKAKVERYFTKYGDRTVFIGRFAAGVRAWIFFSAGVSGMSFLKFFLYDGAAALASVPLLVVLAFYFGENINQIIAFLAAAKKVVLGVVICALPFVIWWWLRRRRRAKASETITEPPAASPPPIEPPPEGPPPTA